MTFKITNAFRILSIIVLVFVFFISYAGLPEQVLLVLDDNGNPIQYVVKNYFFYGTLAILIIANALIYVLANILRKSTKLINQVVSAHLMSLLIVINIFFMVVLSFIGILNGQENFDYSAFAPFIYLPVVLFFIWLITFVYSVIQLKKNV